MTGNRICRQIEWYENESHLAAWQEGRTGYPYIDAVMRQLVRNNCIIKLVFTAFLGHGRLHPPYKSLGSRFIFDKRAIMAQLGARTRKYVL
jgi:hypothetical protein